MSTPKGIELTCIHEEKEKLWTCIIGKTIVHFGITNDGERHEVALKRVDIEKLAAHIIELLDHME